MAPLVYKGKVIVGVTGAGFGLHLDNTRGKQPIGTVNGEKVHAVGQASKTGWFYAHDRTTGALLYKSEPFVPQENLFAPPPGYRQWSRTA